MPFSVPFGEYRLVEQVRALRQNPFAAYGIAVAAVAVGTLARWALAGYAMEGTPFITLFPAVIIATLFGGLWPGVLAVLLSSVAGWFLFISPEYHWALDQREIVSLSLFAAVGGVNVALITLLNTAVDRVLAQDENIRTLFESAPNGILVVNEKGNIRFINASMEQLFGYARLELVGQNIEMLVPASVAHNHRALRDSFLRAPQARPMGIGRDLKGRRKDGSEFPVEIGLSPVERNGKVGVLATVIDISERKRAEAQQHLLVGELQHRTNNLFTVIQYVAARSLDESRTVADARSQFSGRLQALARAYTMLAKAAWAGAPLAEILRQELAAFAGSLTVSGCEIVLNAPASQQFALVVHELATNALKHGALSARGGRVSVEGNVERSNGEDIFSFIWKETGGPVVSQPAHKGFGSTILVDAARGSSKSVVMDFRPEGLSYELKILLNAISASKSADSAGVAVRELHTGGP